MCVQFDFSSDVRFHCSIKIYLICLLFLKQSVFYVIFYIYKVIREIRKSIHDIGMWIVLGFQTTAKNL